MAKPYMPPMDRKRMMKPMAGNDSPAPESSGSEGEDEMPASPERGEGDAGNPSEHSEFLPKEFLGGKEYKPGDRIELTVKAVDPQTGEVEVSCAPDDDEKSPPSLGMMDKLGE